MSSLLLVINKNPASSKLDDIYNIKYTTSKKFHKDKVNFENNKYRIVLDGVVLNKKELLATTQSKDFANCLIDLYEKEKDKFVKKLRGSYYGFLFDLESNHWVIFNDHIGSKPLYYFQNNNSLIVSNNYTLLLSSLKKRSISLSLNEQAAYLLLSYGYVFENITLVSQIERLLIGYMIKVDDQELFLEKYYQLTNKPINISRRDAISELDKRFRQAIVRSFEKDKEYGYKHVATLSGGLDSRMTVWVAHQLGYTDQLNMTFSQSNYLDESVAKRIATDLKHDWIFKTLDHGNFLKAVDKAINISGGNALYPGIAHGISMFEFINFEQLGILHSGQLGDVVISSFYSTLDRKKEFTLGDGAYSKKLLKNLESYEFKETYENEEIYKMYIRGFYGANQGLTGAMNYTETFSPFYDIDFMSYCFTLPLELRYKHRIYKDWICEKYPKAAEYIWEAQKVPVNYKWWLKFRKSRVPLSQLSRFLSVKFGLRKRQLATKEHMNPLQYWYESNPTLRGYLDDYFDQNISSLSAHPKLKTDCERLYNTGTAMEKTQVISLLGSVRLYQSPVN